jgi:GNAT superfamily N-acetyltransferase
MTTAYSGVPSDGKLNAHLLSHLIPYKSQLKDGRHVEVDFFRHSQTHAEECEVFAGMALMNLVIREGRSWPFEEDFTSVDAYRGYFLSHTAFVARALDNGMDAKQRNSSSKGEMLGCFYIKPNFPGRCSHVCNGGFITAPRFRGLGVARLMGNVFLRAARDLGYKSSYFNLVFKSNVGSVKLWESLGFERVTVLEKAARLEGLEEGELDTAYGYRYDLEKLPEDYLGVEVAPHRSSKKV